MSHGLNALEEGVHYIREWDEDARVAEINDKYREGPDTDMDEITRIRVRSI